MEITDINNAPHYHWGDNCNGWLLLNTPDLSVKEELMQPGTREQLHYHKSARQFFYILEGVASFYIAGQKVRLNSSQGLKVLPGVHHQIVNESASHLKFLVISQPSTENDRVNLPVR